MHSCERFDHRYLTFNAKGLVPILVDDKVPIVDSSVIMQFVENKRPSPSLLPGKPIDSALMRQLMKHIDDLVHTSTGNIMHTTLYRTSFLALEGSPERSDRPTPHDKRRQRRAAAYKDGNDAPFVIRAIKRFNELISDLEVALTKGPFLTGLT